MNTDIINEINRLQKAIIETKSIKLAVDYSKAITRLNKQLIDEKRKNLTKNHEKY